MKNNIDTNATDHRIDLNRASNGDLLRDECPSLDATSVNNAPYNRDPNANLDVDNLHLNDNDREDDDDDDGDTPNRRVSSEHNAGDLLAHWGLS